MDLELKKHIDDNLEKLVADDDVDVAKSIVCKFYRGGGNPGCKRCMQQPETVLDCKEEYILKIASHPMEYWEKAFDSLNVREKVSVDEVKELAMNCNRCYMSEKCPMFLANATCGIDFGQELEKLTPVQITEKLIEIQFERVNRGRKVEAIDGGVPDQTLSGEIDRLTGMIKTKGDLQRETFSLKIEGSRPADSDGPGLLASIFGNNSAPALPKAEEQKTLDISHTEPMPVKEEIAEAVIVEDKPKVSRRERLKQLEK